MQRFKKWFLSIIKNFKQHEKIKIDLNNTKIDLNNTKIDLNNTKIDLNNTKIELSQLKKEHYKVLDFHLRKITPQAFLEIVEIHLAESCNLNCFGCNHFSQIAEKEFPDIEIFKKDMQRLSEISKGIVGTFRLMGGEPLLNPNCIQFFDITRYFFPKSAIWLVTNGILLDKQNEDFWNSCQRNKMQIRPTKYPIKINWDLIKDKCDQYDIPLIFFNNGELEKTSWKFSLDPSGNCDNYHSFTNCSMAITVFSLKMESYLLVPFLHMYSILIKSMEIILKFANLTLLIFIKPRIIKKFYFFFLSLFLFVDIARYHNGQKLENGVLAIKQNMNI